MFPTTEERLKSYLDTNQQSQERICLAVLATDKQYSAIKPRHPQGGPDGGRDIDAKFKSDKIVYGAVGFIASGNDSASDKTAIKKKFKEDLRKAADAAPKPKVFTFFTNVRLTLGEKDDFRKLAITVGMEDCDIFDRERIRIALDSPDGLAARFQYLNIPMSDAEQASFFARWGDDIQSVISNGFGRLETKLSHILFAQEANDPLDSLHFRVQLDRIYAASEIGHFRLFATFHRGEFGDGLWAFLVGASDRAHRMYQKPQQDFRNDTPGIGAGMSHGQWIQTIKDFQIEKAGEIEEENWFGWSGGSSIGVEPVSMISIGYSQGGLLRVPPYLRLKDLDGGMFVLYANKSLVEKIASIQVFGNSYKMLDIDKSEIRPEHGRGPEKLPVEFTPEELADPWAILRPATASTFRLNFSEQLPIRFYDAQQVQPIRERLKP